MTIIVILILALSAFLRLYNLPINFVFAGDEEHQAILAQSLIRHFHIIWIGVNAGHLGFYLGPYWAYFTALWLFLSKGDPLITGYISSLIGVLTTLLVIITGSSLFNKKIGLLAGLLYATLPLMVFFDQKYWNPAPIPLLSALMLLSLFKAKTNPRWLILFAAAFGLVFHSHLSLAPLILVAIYWLFKQKIKPGKTIIILSLISFLIMIAPLIAFDYFHKGSNITTPLRYKEITADYRNKINPAHHLNALFGLLGRVWYIKAPSVNADEVIISCAAPSRLDTPANLISISQRFNPPVWLSLTGTAILLLFLLHKKTRQNSNTALLALFIISITGAFIFFPGGAFEYYLLGIFPLLLFLPGVLAGYYPKLELPVTLALIVVVILGIFTVISNKGDFGLAAKINLIKQAAAEIGHEPFELKQTGVCHFYEAWRYLFVLNGKKPERSDSDQGLGWLYPEEISKNPVKYTIILSESRVPVDFDTKGAKILKSGGFTAYIFQN